MLRVLRFCTLSLLVQAVPAFACWRDSALEDPFPTDDETPVFVGRASAVHSYVDPKLGIVMSEYTVTTIECLRGVCEPTATVVTFGGEVGDLVTRVVGQKNGPPRPGDVMVFRAGVRGRASAISSSARW